MVGAAYPDPPWRLHGSMWVSLFWLPHAVEGRDGVRPRGPWGAAWVDYTAPSPLTYRELLVARPVRAGAAGRVRITDIWVDSPASRDGGRALWAIPKGLAVFSAPPPPGFPVSSDGSGWSATVGEGGRGHGRRGGSAAARTAGPAAVRHRPAGTARPLGSVRLEAFRLRFG